MAGRALQLSPRQGRSGFQASSLVLLRGGEKNPPIFVAHGIGGTAMQLFRVVRHFNLSITDEEDSSFMRKRVNRYWVLLCVIALGLSLGAKVSYADTPGKHPSYLHALSDLRHARAYLDKLAADDQIDNDSMRAIREIDAAIGEIKRAAIDDGKDLSDHPKIDTNLRRTDRFHKAIELLNKAAGVKFSLVPYKGGATQVTALLGGEVPLGHESLNVALPFARAGKLKIIALTARWEQAFAE